SENGIIIFIDKVPGVAHNKVMVIDDKYVLTGSYNWTHNAEYKNAENLLLIYDKHTNRIYRQNWEQRVQQSTNYLASVY
ncbi:MAG: phospholipase D-like domain-containing protein, partial [Candidatus Amoebophilus sp.]